MDWIGTCEANMPAVVERLCEQFGIADLSSVFQADDLRSVEDATFIHCLAQAVFAFCRFGFTSAEIDSAIMLGAELYQAIVTGYTAAERIIIEDDSSSRLTALGMLLRRYSTQISGAKLAYVAKYFAADLVQHAQLYRLCAFNLRQDGSRSDVRTILIPPSNMDMPPLQDSTRDDVYKYNKKLEELFAELEAATKTMKLNADSKKSAVHLASRQIVQQKFDEWEYPGESKEAYQRVKSIVEAVVKSHSDILATELKCGVDATFQELNGFCLQTALPRPARLGPPPRFQLKSAKAAVPIRLSADKAKARPTSKTARTTTPKTPRF